MELHYQQITPSIPHFLLDLIFFWGLAQLVIFQNPLSLCLLLYL